MLPRAEIIDQAQEPTKSTVLTEGAGTTLTLPPPISREDPGMRLAPGGAVARGGGREFGAEGELGREGSIEKANAIQPRMSNAGRRGICRWRQRERRIGLENRAG